MIKKIVKLVSISEYAKHWGIDRKTVYRLMNKGKIVRYENEKPKLNRDEKPPVQKYGKRKAIRIRSRKEF